VSIRARRAELLALSTGVALVAGSGAVMQGCASTLPPEGQLVVHVDTDAPLPSSARDAAPALFDRLRIDIVAPGEASPCVGCSREVPVTRELFAERRASLGLAPSSRSGGHRVRVRLYRGAWLVNGEPSVETSLETVVVTPAVPAEGIVDVTVRLRMDDVGRPQGSLDAPLAAEPGSGSKMARWAPAERAPCVGEPDADEACVPGGAFWMGDPAIATLTASELDGDLPRVVALSPFFVDVREVSVAAFRKAALPGAGGADGDPAEGGTCTFTSTPGPNEERPVTCVSFARAKEYCAALGKEVLSEARFEYLAGGLASRAYVWGTDDPGCGDAVYGRDPRGTERTKVCVKTHGTGPAPSGSGARDRLLLGDREVVDLAGNVGEWMQDAWAPQTSRCWGTGVLHDPVCTAPGNEQSVRGGSWALFDILCRAQTRTKLVRAVRPSGDIGFRCARPAR